MNTVVVEAPAKAPAVWALQAEMLKMPQLELPTEHYFSNGMYCRKLRIPTGTLIVGKVHKDEHLFICAMGRISVWSDEHGTKELVAGDVITSAAGAKRAGMALEDCIVINVHKTDLTDLALIEAALIEPDETSLIGPDNMLKIGGVL